ncbi:MAG: gliding motility-associated C-terminal domain-containing protein [Ferruginibacter sp.]
MKTLLTNINLSRLKFLLAISLYFIVSEGLHAQNCSDTSFKKLYSSPDAILNNRKYLVNKKDTSLLAGTYTNNVTKDTAIYIMKLASLGNVIWAKEIKTPSHERLPNNLLQLDNGDIIFSFLAFEGDIRIVKLDIYGNLVWTKSLSMQGYVFISDLNIYTSNNKLYLAFNSSSIDVSASYWNTTIVKLDENANVLWSKFYSNNTADCFNAIPASLIKVDDSLIVLGRVPLLYCSLPSATTTEESYYSLKVNELIGKLGKSMNYTLLKDLWYPGSGGIGGRGNNYNVKITHTNNNQYFFTSNLFKPAINKRGRFYKIRFDTDLNFYEGSLYTTDTIASGGNTIDVDEDGNTNIVGNQSKVGISNTYFGKFDINNNVIRQKSITAANNETYTVGINSIARKRRYINFVATNIKNNKNYLQLLQLNSEEQNSDCFGRDTSFIQVSTYNITPYKSPFFEKAFDIDATMIDVNNITVSDIIITKEDVCDQVSLCSEIKLKGPTDIICNLNQKYIYKASLNKTCYKHVFWQIDSSAISELTPIDDTTVSIKFKDNFQGYLYASVNSCMDLKDSIKLEVYNSPTTINLGSDTSLCRGQQITLDAKPGFKKYKWQDGSSNSFLLANESGKYFVQATDYCDNVFSDTINIKVNEPTPINIGKDTSICNGQFLTLNPGNNFESYLWNNGQTSPSIKVTAKGVYSVLVKNEYGCASTDTMKVLDVYALPFFSLNKKNILCREQNDTLFVAQNFSSYLWQDGSSNYFYHVFVSGTIKLTVTNEHGCIASDSVAIKQIENAPSDFFGEYLPVCKDETIVLKPTSSFSDYLWSTGSKMPSIQVPPGNYLLNVMDINGCVGIDSINILSKDCSPVFFVPNAFTPNNDGLNDIFKPIISGHVEQYKFIIYNRFGQQIFSSQKINEGWDGTIRGKPQDTGTFIWTCSYKFRNEKNEFKKGTMVLIR